MDRTSDRSQHSHSRKGASNRSRHHENKSGSQKHTISYLLNDKSQEEKPDEIMRDVDVSANSHYQRTRMTPGSSKASSSTGRARASRGHLNSKVDSNASRISCSHCNLVFSAQSELEEQCVRKPCDTATICCRAVPFYPTVLVLTSLTHFYFLSPYSNLQFAPSPPLPFLSMSSVFVYI